MATKSRYWMVTIQVGNLKKMGLTDAQITDAEYSAKYIASIWENSAPSRRACVSACISKGGHYHFHAAMYGEKTTLLNVSRIMYDSHVEPAKGGKGTLLRYVMKEGEFQNSGEQILYVYGKDNLKNTQGKRSDLEQIECLINKGYTPIEIYDEKFSYRRHDQIIRKAFVDKKIKDAPTKKNMLRVWHVDVTSSDANHIYDELCASKGAENIYYVGYLTTGWADNYFDNGAPSTLVIDLRQPVGSLNELINILDVYTTKTIHSRYKDVYPLWNEVHIVSDSFPEEAAFIMADATVQREKQIKRLMDRIDYIEGVYFENQAIKRTGMFPIEDINQVRAILGGSCVV